MKQKIAEITDYIEKLFPNGRAVLVYELKKNDFENVQKEFGIKTNSDKQFKIDISGSEVIFILDELLKDEKDTSSETP
jgi:hypothetical protein